MSDLKRFQQHCRLLRRITTAVWVGLALLLLLPFVVIPLASLLLRGDLSGHGWRVATVHVLPGWFYLWGLWAVRRALGELALGRLFAVTVARALRQIGCAVMAGALLSLFAVTNLTRVIEHGRGGYAYFDLSGIMLAIVGAALVLLARLVEQARRMQAELDEIL
ncbi:DUF2975 domain-containing protein [Frateuria sp. STR12]|uniref:DUF2975 domain-containing protein n=1 Tax=Frateuria hangzhouensis TaxID=2995589 RepID=UPI002260A448|nr:DUF2975 domain-containing protein [Frateuria sp. STR12]MCX7514145.1 DUF2975 domain-containing protein [Frateuria sp. STR12]